MRIIVTGSASGIGAACAVRLASDAARRGGKAHILLVDLAAAGLEATAAAVRAEGGEAVPHQADLSQPGTAAEAVATAVARFGGLDVLVSNAGILRRASLLEMSEEDYDLTFAVNTKPTWSLARAAHPHLAASGGCIIATTSTASEEPTPGLGVYAASKAALLMMMRQMANEWGPDGIRCNCIAPGATHTGMTQEVYGDPAGRERRARHIPLRRVATPADLAAAVSFLAGPDAAYVTGMNLAVDGGMLTTLMNAR